MPPEPDTIMNNRKRHTKEVLFSAGEIRRAVQKLAGRISADYADKDLMLVAILKGSVIFFSDILRNLKIHCGVEFMSVASYEGTRSTGVVRILADLRESPAGKHILLVEDIADSGATLDYLRKNLLDRGAASVRICVLLDKKTARKVPVKIDYRGFVVPDTFVVGYGLDHRERYRGLPYIGVLPPEEHSEDTE